MSIFYKSLLILDKGKNVARKIEFQPGINIVTSHLNSVGKTSLSLMLLHSFGAKVRFSDKWDLSNVFTKLTIQKDSSEIEIIRHRDTYTIITGDEKYYYPLQKNGYAEKLYELLGLTIKIKDKNSDTYSTAIPSLYLLPYFLSQTKTDVDRSVFEDLNMYSKSDLRDALYYHVGELDNHYSSVIQQLTQSRKKLEELRKSREKQISEIEYLERKLAESKSAKLIDSDADLDADIAVYQKYSKKKQDYYSLVKTQSDIKHKIKLLNATLKDNLVYTAKLLDGEDIICPVCNSNITDFISSALKVGIAESDINTELASLKADLLNTDRKIALAKPKLDELHQEIMLIEQQRENVKITRAIIVWNEELLVAKKNFAEIQLQIDSLEASIKGYSEEMRNYNEKKQSADKSYRSAFVTLLNATNISTDGLDISSLNLYDSLHLSGSEIPRVAISRFFSLLESKTADSIVMPIIFDFPNLDMTEENLTKCFQVMCEKISDTKTYPQSFIFSINCEERISKAGASLEKINIIDIESLPMDDSANPKLLCKHDYSAYSKEISEMINS